MRTATTQPTTPSSGSSVAPTRPIGWQLRKAKKWARGRLVVKCGKQLFWTEDTFPFSQHFMENKSRKDPGHPVFFSAPGHALTGKQLAYFRGLPKEIQDKLTYSYQMAVEKLKEHYRLAKLI